MKNPVYIIIGVLVIVAGIVIYMAFKTPNQANQPTGSASAAADPMTDLLAQISTGESNCSKDCRKLCGGLPDKLFGCGQRCQCKNNCNVSCVKGENYKALYP